MWHKKYTIHPFHTFNPFMPQSCTSVTTIKFRDTHCPNKEILNTLPCLSSSSPPSSAPSPLGKLPSVSIDVNILGYSHAWNHTTYSFCYWLFMFCSWKSFFLGGRGKGSHVVQLALTLVDSRGQLRISDPSTSISWVLGLQACTHRFRWYWRLKGVLV